MQILVLIQTEGATLKLIAYNKIYTGKSIVDPI